MLYLKDSEKIKKQADFLINKKNLNQFFSNFGDLIYTGSYALNLMTWRDIDLQLKITENKNKSEIISSIFSHMLNDSDVLHMEYTNSSKTRYPEMPEGDYLQFRIIDEGEKIWKMDLWILKEHDFQENRVFMTKMEEMLKQNINARNLILQMKYEFMENSERPPKMASYFLYQAILFEKLNNKEEILNFIKDNGVKI